jgi:hypothetical protein
VNVGPVGTGFRNVDASLRAASTAQVQAALAGASSGEFAKADTIAELLERLAVTGIPDLILHLEERRSALDAGALRDLLSAAAEAAVLRDLPAMREALTRLVSLNPNWIEHVRTEPRFEPVKHEVKALLGHLLERARQTAEQQLTEAGAGVEAAGGTRRDSDVRDARAVLELAARLCEHGQHIDYVRAGELAAVVLLHFPITPPPVMVEGESTGAGVRRRRVVERVADWWKRAPVLVLFAGWGLTGCLAALLTVLLRTAVPDAAGTPGALAVWAAGFVGFVAWIRWRSTHV